MENEEDFVLVFLLGLPVEGETSGSGAEVSECSLVFRVGGKYRAQLSKERAVRRLKELDERFSADRHWACTTAFRPLSWDDVTVFALLHDSTNAERKMERFKNGRIEGCFIFGDSDVGIFFCGIEGRAGFRGEVAVTADAGMGELLF